MEQIWLDPESAAQLRQSLAEMLSCEQVKEIFLSLVTGIWLFGRYYYGKPCVITTISKIVLEKVLLIISSCSQSYNAK